MLGCSRDPSNSDKHHLFCRWYLFGSTTHYWEGRQPKVYQKLKPQNSWRWATWKPIKNQCNIGPVSIISAYQIYVYIYVMWLYRAYTLMCFQNLPRVCTLMILNSQHWSTPTKWCPSNVPDQNLSEVLKWLQIQKHSQEQGMTFFCAATHLLSKMQHVP